MDDAALRRALAFHGVGLFHPAPVARRPTESEYADLVAALVASDDPRLVASVPCLLAFHDEGAASAVVEAASRLDAPRRTRLGLLHRLARALAVSRDPDLRHVLGRSRRIAASALEPSDLPAHDEDDGERCLSVAREVHDADPDGNIVIDVVDLFVTWLRLAETDRLEAAVREGDA